MSKRLLFFICLLWTIGSAAQTMEAGYSFSGGSKGQLPFWLWANQLGVYNLNSTSNHNLQLKASNSSSIGNTDFRVEGQIQFNILRGDEYDIRFTEAAGGINWKFLQLKFGAFAEQEIYQGLSASNGNLYYSRNARPHPRLRLGFNRYVQLLPKWLSVYGFYEEGLLNDERHVENTHLHHKALYLRIGQPNTIEITGGLEHYVMWWGTHPVYGELPGWSDYFKYISGGSGDDNALETDQLNVLGNGYGTYQLEIKKSWGNFESTFYLSHPFEDRSGLEWENWRDNLYGFFLSFTKDQPFLKGIALEYYHTKNQSGDYHLYPRPDESRAGRGLDNYFNNGVYRSGVSFEQMNMGSPLITPVVLDDGISKGFENNSISGIHLGANGFISPALFWKTMLTYTSNFGQKKRGGTTTYDPERKQLSMLMELNWQLPNIPVYLGGSFAADEGSLFDRGEKTTRMGAMVSITWQIQSLN